MRFLHTGRANHAKYARYSLFPNANYKNEVTILQKTELLTLLDYPFQKLVPPHIGMSLANNVGHIFRWLHCILAALCNNLLRYSYHPYPDGE